MIPNIFVSSTISDLHYLRDALRDSVADLSYNPVMSDYGEVGYLHPHTAAASCYRSLRQCQMMVLIIGKRYGSVSPDGFSVTHREFLTAQEYEIPTISFVEGQVLNYKEVYEADTNAVLWDNFPGMDNPRKTFAFIDSVTSSAIYNGLIPFTSVADAKRILKLQIADFVGERLNETIKPVRSEVQEVLAEIKTMRNQMMHSASGASQTNEEAKQYLTVMRFLLDDRHADYRTFVEKIAGDLDVAIPQLIRCKTFVELISALKHTIVMEEDREAFEVMFKGQDHQSGPYMRQSTRNMHGWYGIYTDNRVVLNSTMTDYFDKSQASLQGRLKIQNS
jgi:hypothetical protein